MADDIIQRIIIEAVDKVSTVANSLVQSVTGVANKIKSAFAGVNADAVTESFAGATASISALGNTAKEALGAAAAAAQKFGASAKDLQQVEGVIAALNARARDSSKSFTELATAYDQARGTLAGGAAATGQAGQGIAQVGQASQGAAPHVANLHRQMGVLLGVLSLMGGGPIASVASAIGSVGIIFGTTAAAVAALAAAFALLTKASIDTAKLAEGLQKLNDAAGMTGTAASRVVQALGMIGVGADEAAKSLTGLLQRAASMGPQLRDEIAGAADKIAAAFDRVTQAQINVERIPLKAEQLNQQQQSLALQMQALDFRRQELALQGQQLALGARQIGLQQQQTAAQLRDLPQQQAFQQRSVELNLLDAQARLRILLLQRQLRDGTISQAEFEEKMAQEEDRALNRAIARARLDVDQARAEKAGLSEKQSFEQQSLQLQQEQLRLAQQQNALQQQQQPLRSSELDQQEKQIRLQQQMLELDRRQQEIDARQAQRDLREAERERDKAVANDIRDAIKEMTAALKEGREPKFGPDVTDETKMKAFFAAMNAEMEASKGNLAGLVEQIQNLFKTDFGKSAAGQNLAKQLGIEGLADALRSSGTSFADLLKQIDALGTAIDPKKFDAVRDAANQMTGTFAALKDKAAEINTEKAVIQLDNMTAAMKRLAEQGKIIEPQGGGSFLDKLKDAFKGMLSGAKASGEQIIPSGGILDLLGNLLISPAGAAELKDRIAKPIEDGAKAGIEGASNLDTSGIVQQFAGLSEKIAEVFANMVTMAANAAEQIAQAFSGIGERIRQAISGGGAGADTGDTGGGTTGNVFSAWTDQATQAVETIVQAFAGVGDRIVEAFSSIGDRAAEAFSAMASAAKNTAGEITGAFSEINITEPLSSQIDALIQKFNDLASAARSAAAAASAGGSGGGGGGGGGGGNGGGSASQESFAPTLAALGMAGGDAIIAPSLVRAAGGGLFRGRSGIDTNLAWLTDGEFVIRAAAVQRYGIGLFNLINSMQFPGFHMGGMALPRLAPIPAFAGGGLNRSGSQRTLNLTIGGETFRGLSAPEHVAQQLERAAISRQTSSTGIKPRWSR